MASAVSVSSPAAAPDERLGFVLVFAAAVCWSLGGMFARFIEIDDPWAVIFWRSVWAAAILVIFMLVRDGLRGTLAMFRSMGIAGIVVAACLTVCTSAFVVALGYTTVANILLIQAGTPLVAALLSFVLLAERIPRFTWIAIFAVIFGVGVMVSDSLGSSSSLIGNLLAVLIVIMFSIVTVTTRRFSHVRMTPAMCLGTLMAAGFAATQASSVQVSVTDMGFLFAFGAVNLGLGLAFFATGARMIAASYAALLATFETLLGPVWVWLVHAEVPSTSTLIGGAIVFAALLSHIGMQLSRLSRPQRPGTSGIGALR
ncbi:DMT family transporter [Aquamicrobium zhengzhouense]|uniref:DMT family transporter n=1 Tax=Aquamicrobium zhengzhouense TaxID=2781738 RepID=UPI00389903F7